METPKILTSIDKSVFRLDTSLSSRSTIPFSFNFSTSSCVCRCCSHSICRWSSNSFFAACHIIQLSSATSVCKLKHTPCHYTSLCNKLAIFHFTHEKLQLTRFFLTLTSLQFLKNFTSADTANNLHTIKQPASVCFSPLFYFSFSLNLIH